MSVITHTYDTYAEATRAVADLEAAGIPHADITLVSGDETSHAHHVADGTVGTRDEVDQAKADAAGTGATVGTVLGGGVGLLAGLGMLAIPGVGPLVAAGWLVATLTGAGVGAAAGGLASALVGSGLTEKEAHRHAEHVGRGGTLVSARVDDAMDATARSMLLGGSAMTGDATLAGTPASAMEADFARHPHERGTVANNPVTRTADEALGTDVSGEHPEHREGTIENPPGTAASRAVDHATGTNLSGDNPAHRAG